MKKLFLFIATICLSLTINAFAGPANPPGPKKHPQYQARPHNQPRPHNQASLPQKAKTNKGWEFKADKNKDGTVEKVEYKHWDKTHPHHPPGQQPGQNPNQNPHQPPNMMKADQNQDGQVDKVEAHKAQQNSSGMQPHPKPPIKDMNNDGEVNDLDRQIMIRKGPPPQHHPKPDGTTETPTEGTTTEESATTE